jgi:predicted ester cyclase
MQDLKETVKPFYTACLNANSGAGVQQVINSLLADDFENINTAQRLDKEAFKHYVPGIFQMIPNLKCDIQEMLQDGNKVIVRSIISGNPVGNFFGVLTDGKKAFSVMAIDIHTVENQKIKSVYHLEEWTTAFQQLQS